MSLSAANIFLPQPVWLAAKDLEERRKDVRRHRTICFYRTALYLVCVYGYWVLNYFVKNKFPPWWVFLTIPLILLVIFVFIWYPWLSNWCRYDNMFDDFNQLLVSSLGLSVPVDPKDPKWYPLGPRQRFSRKPIVQLAKEFVVCLEKDRNADAIRQKQEEQARLEARRLEIEQQQQDLNAQLVDLASQLPEGNALRAQIEMLARNSRIPPKEKQKRLEELAERAKNLKSGTREELCKFDRRLQEFEAFFRQEVKGRGLELKKLWQQDLDRIVTSKDSGAISAFRTTLTQCLREGQIPGKPDDWPFVSI